MQIINKPNYHEADQMERERLLQLIELERAAFLDRIKPYQEALASIEARTPRTIMIVDL